jgi:hypothetical protein
MSKIITNAIENVAGTEIHNVDTMGIERGTDTITNGAIYWTKLPDGTLLARGFKNVTVAATTQWLGIIPTPTPSIGLFHSGTCGISSINTKFCFQYNTSRNKTETQWEAAFRTYDGSATSETYTIEFTFIGRWK